ncbi:MAG: chemotaxis response regulator protein-glutamate methylesterase [Campylobacterales bacterium]|nr:chemotaxis response regulator protein-glutamate methylesterase [Campylobacterales bacterium]
MSKKVLIVDDSALVRKQLSEIIETLGYEIETAKNGQEAVECVKKKAFDLITMDVNMPVMDGLTAVKEIMKSHPTPILMISSLTSEDASTTIEALELGALDYIAKPGTMNVGKRENRDDILEKVQQLSAIPKRRLERMGRRPVQRMRSSGESRVKTTPQVTEFSKVVLVGSSTGGPGLIEQICASLPPHYPYPVCVVQHMPEKFTKAFAERLDRVSALNVHESAHNQELLPGHIYVARGGVHMHFSKKVSGKFVIREEKEDNGRFFKPSVDEMFHSALKQFGGKNIIAVILTGIGDDGADGMVAIKQAGGYTIGESEASATVYGMPKEAYDRGGVTEQLDFPQIVKKIVTL